METKTFTSKINPRYSVKCWGDRTRTYVFQKQYNSITPEHNDVYQSLPPNECPTAVVEELRPLAHKFLGLEF